MNKRPKKAGALEEDDSSVEVYYREGEEEIEEPNVLPKVRATQGKAAGEGDPWTSLFSGPVLFCLISCKI